MGGLIKREVEPQEMSESDGRAEREQTEEAAKQAERCRRLSTAVYDRETSELLRNLAADFDRRAQSKTAD